MAKKPSKSIRQRSPNYPAISLREAVERVAKLYKEDGKAGSPLDVAVQRVGYSSAHGQAMTVISALRKFRLIDLSNKRVQPTQIAIDIIQFPDGHPRKVLALREAALGPAIYSELLKHFLPHGNLPADDALRPELIADWDFAPKAVGGFIKDFRDSMIFAGLMDESGILSAEGVAGLESMEGEQPGNEEPLAGPPVPVYPTLGDWVQRVRDGKYQFPGPRRVQGVSPDSEWVFVEGETLGHPMEQVVVMTQAIGHTGKSQMPPPNPYELGLAKVPEERALPAGLKEDAFAMREGRAVLRYPEKIDLGGVDELEDWLKLIIRKIRRTNDLPPS